MSPAAAQRARIILVTVTVALVAVILWQARSSLTPFILGSLLAYLLLPAVRRIERLFPFRGRLAGARRPLAILIVYLLVIGLMVGIVNTVIPPLARQMSDLAARAPTLVQEARAEGNEWLARYYAIVPDEIEATIEANVAQLGASLTAGLRAMLSNSLTLVARTVTTIVGLLIVPLWLFYVLKDEQQGWRFFYSLFPSRVVGDVRAIVAIVNDVLGRYIRGQLLLGLVIGATSFIGLSIIDVPYVLVLAVINGIFELIPIIGPWLGAIPGVIVTLAVAPDKVGWVILFYILLQQIENTVLVPKVQGDAVELKPALIIMLLVIAGNVAGLWGLLVAVPLTAIARDIVTYLYRRFSPPAAAVMAAPGLQGREAAREDQASTVPSATPAP